MKKCVYTCSFVLALIISGCTTTIPTTTSNPPLEPGTNPQPTARPTFTSHPNLLQPNTGQIGKPTLHPTRI